MSSDPGGGRVHSQVTQKRGYFMVATFLRNSLTFLIPVSMFFLAASGFLPPGAFAQGPPDWAPPSATVSPVSYTHLRAHETKANLVCRLLLEKKKKRNNKEGKTLT